MRAGVDQLLWRDHAVSGAIGAGIGIGFGYAQQPLFGQAVDVLINYELIAHALVYIRIRSNTRIGLGASGVVSRESGLSDTADSWQHLEYVFRLDQKLRLPKRIVPGL